MMTILLHYVFLCVQVVCLLCFCLFLFSMSSWPFYSGMVPERTLDLLHVGD